MSAKRITLGAALTLLAVATIARAQGPAATLPDPSTTALPSPAASIFRPLGEPVPHGGYAGPCGAAGCCGPLGGAPVGEELFVRFGPGIVAGGGLLANQIETGWVTQAGMKTLLFNKAGSAAWTIDTHLMHQYNNGSGSAEEFSFFGLPVTVRDLFRWYVGAGFGREWFLFGSANASAGSNVRFGVELGGRYGTGHVNLNLLGEFPEDPVGYLRRHDVIGAFYMAAHAGVDVPFGTWNWFAGLRVEWSQTWSDVLPAINSDVRDVNILLSTGVRF